MSKKPEFPKGMDALLGSLEQGHFQNPMIMSQLLPVLNGKSYLDIATMECRAEQGNRKDRDARLRGRVWGPWVPCLVADPTKRKGRGEPGVTVTAMGAFEERLGWKNPRSPANMPREGGRTRTASCHARAPHRGLHDYWCF